MIDVKTIEYDVELVTESGATYILNDALIRLQWEEQRNELAQRATISLANFRFGNTYLISLAKINCLILIYAKWNGNPRQLCFEGTIWEWAYVSATNKELTLTAYDHLIRLQQSRDFKYYSAGMTTEGLIGDICDEWGIPYSYEWSQSIIHEKKVFSGERISDIIISLLEEIKQKTGESYIAYFREGLLKIVDYGTNDTIYTFDGENTMSTHDKLTINDLVTRVKVIGKQDDEGRAPVDAIVDGNLEYGVLQEIIRRDGSKTLAATMDEANAVIKTRGKPEEITSVNVPDVPLMRKGDLIELNAGNLIGFFYAEGVEHIGTTRRMNLLISRVPAEDMPGGAVEASQFSTDRPNVIQ
jgi:hypothetical protein